MSARLYLAVAVCGMMQGCATLTNDSNENPGDISKTLPPVSDTPQDFTEKLIEQIVGIEITVSRLSGKWKVSQNQPAENQISVIKGLHISGKLEMAALVADTSRQPIGYGK